MLGTDTLVSVGLPVRNGAARLEGVARSVLAQDHENIELVICDNASTDDTEEFCRELARSDSRITYHRQPENVGLLNNFIHAGRIARGTFFRWVGDDDWLAPECVSRSLRAFAEDERLILVTTQVSYSDPDGMARTGVYEGTGLLSDDPVERFAEMLRMLNESHLLIDPLYGLMRRASVVGIPRRNMLREDEVFAAKLALAGPWGHVPEVLARRNWKHERIGAVGRRLGVPAWQARFSSTLQYREILRWLREADLTGEQRGRARAAAHRMYARRQWRTVSHRGRKLARLGTGLILPGRSSGRSAAGS
ncbi:glycosyltransferase family 2 protein [Streptosporangium roseum]|uniref:Glycosyltransferase involved in cell wall biogenesis-like protein n=1 Tax=Streptosporangium roseum (strain ATCC 12428 / DSM 43021 / JCM 3005 / KCTC 9067 / NCIMB 10171 / NRRL 2505 / NI 9100) TaxID=479432 RepID=D2B4H9_STRRD|nr:glycosyltransferase family 2 protein [Streptosporangium roseum]ACZ83665.1 Glycosyltransferase involved in cell wall biogenesis-like protein [Streptosporangium roseum DSM 43021]